MKWNIGSGNSTLLYHQIFNPDPDANLDCKNDFYKS